MSGVRHSIPVAVIIGMMGAGKTRVGKEVAHIMDLPFADADVEIQHDIGMGIPEFFEREGEPAFRKVEADLIADMLEDFDGIFSLGGGAPMTPSTQRALAEYIDRGGRVVYLDADPAEAMERANRGGGRPMLNGDADARWKKLYKERDPVFRRVANVRVRTRGQTPQMAARKVMDMIRERMVHVTGSGIEPYDVRIGEGTMNHLPDVLGEGVARVALIHTQPVQRHSDHARTLLRQAGYTVSDIVVPDAEAGKTVDVANGVWRRLGDEGFTRSDAIVGLGGGAATDLAGFIAATWMRGIRYVNWPDLSTGHGRCIHWRQDRYQHRGGQEPGRFVLAHPCRCACGYAHACHAAERHLHRGFGRSGEVGLHHGDPEDTADSRGSCHANRVRSTARCSWTPGLRMWWLYSIEHTVGVKAYHVSADLKEAGLREFLNHGHTLGHAIEKLEHFRWRHGNAVAVGCVYAAELSHLLGYIDQDLVDYHRSLLGSLGLPTSWNNGSWSDVLALMHRDKKARGNKLRFVVLESVGHPIHLEDPPADAVEEAFRRIQQ